MKVIIMAGGKQKRWSSNVPKQFVNIDGERIIERSIRLFKDCGEVYIITDKSEFNYLEYLGCNIVAPTENTHELSKFMSSYDVWKDEEEVLFIWGDCYITDDCANKIKEYREDNFVFYGVHSEMIALRIKKTIFKKFINAINYIKSLEEIGEGGLCGSWTLYRLMLGKDLMQHIHYDNFVMIKDESVDFDSEDGLIDWLKLHPEHGGSII